jgi:hypothetical protein
VLDAFAAIWSAGEFQGVPAILDTYWSLSVSSRCRLCTLDIRLVEPSRMKAGPCYPDEVLPGC